jgi:outer membrane protein
MNVKSSCRLLPLLGTALLLFPGAGHSSDFPYLATDPLRTLPAVVGKGVILPGDSSPIPREVRKDFSQPLLLGEALDLAFSNNPKIKWTWADIKVQAGALGEAYAAYLPTFNGSVNYTRDNITYSDPKYKSSAADRFTAQASGSWRIFDFGGRSANRRSAENLLAAALASHDAALQDISARVIKAYFDALTASASLKAKSKDEEIALHTLDSAKIREKKGAISQSDTLRATTALARASLDKNRALGDYEKSVAVLRQYLCLPEEGKLLLPDDLNAQQGGALERKELSLWLAEAQKSHPALVAARKQLASAQEQVTVAKSTGLPAVSLTGNYYKNTSPGVAVTATGAQETTLIVAMSIPLYDGFSSTYKLRGAQAQVDKKKAALDDMEQQVALEIIKAYADTTSALRNLDSSATLLESAESALAVSQRKYAKGAADITELLSTQAVLADSWGERIRCLAEWHSARLQLLANAGKMGRYAVKE